MKEFNEIKKETDRLRIALLYVVVFSILYTMLVYNEIDNRLKEHKKVIELQQKQINQLIIHCKYEKRKF